MAAQLRTLRKLPLSLALVLLLAACETLVEIDVPPHKPRLALNYRLRNYVPDSSSTYYYSTMERDDPYLVLSKSQHILDNSNQASGVSGARVVLRDAAGIVVDSFREKSFSQSNLNVTYHSTTHFMPQPGQEYRLQVSAEGFEPLDVLQKMPLPVAVSTADFEPISNPSNGDPNSRYGFLSISFADVPGQANYYYLNATALDSLQQPIYNGQVRAENEEFVAENPNPVQLFNYFSDSGQDGGVLSMRSKVAVSDGYSFNPAGPGQLIKARFLRIRLQHLSPELYRFLGSEEAYLDSDGNPFAEPVNLYSNVKGGYGIFGTSTASNFIIPIP
jgi:hypothetical protein